MNYHPGGAVSTRRLIEKARLPCGCAVLDMGAGAGETIQILRELGFRSYGIDINPRCEDVLSGDFLQCPFADESFDAVITQCAFFVSGEQEKAIKEAYRVLKRGGAFICSDLCDSGFIQRAEELGFEMIWSEDITEQWREHYFRALWNEEQAIDCSSLPVSKNLKYMHFLFKKG